MMNKIKNEKDVLFICQYFYPEYISSATLPYDTAIALCDSGLSVDVLCGFPKEYNLNKKVSLKETHEGLGIKRLKYLHMNRSTFQGRVVNYFSFTISVLTKFLSFRKYKFIFVYSNPPILPIVAYLANMLFSIKIIFVCFDVYPEIAIRTNMISKNGLISKAMKIINNSVYSRITKVVALSYDMKEFLLNNRSQLDDSKVIVIPNWFEDKSGFDIKSSYKNNLFKDIKTSGKLVISYFGNFGTAQDTQTLMCAIRKMKNDSSVVFMFAGHGNKLPKIKEEVEQEDLRNVYIYDFLHGQDYQDALNLSDIFIVSLESNLTGLAVPSKTYSYMMAGKPIISIMSKNTDISNDLTNYEAGFSIDVGDVSNLISVIYSLKNNQEKRLNMGTKARELYEEKYTKEKCTAKYVSLIKNLYKVE